MWFLLLYYIYIGRYKTNYAQLINLCQKTDTDNASLLNICLQTSEKLIESKGGLFTHQVGLSIQKNTQYVR